MIPLLTPAGYAQTKAKLAHLEQRLAALEGRTDLRPEHLAEVRRSYHDMMRKYLREIKLYEAAVAGQVQGQEGDKAPPPGGE